MIALTTFLLTVAISASALPTQLQEAAAQQSEPLPDRTRYPTASSKKGLQVQMVDDAIAFGCRHAAINVALGQFVVVDGDDRAPTDAEPFTDHTGAHFKFRRSAVAQLDQQVAPLSKAGIVVTAILLATQSNDPAQDALLVHSRCVGRAPNGIAAFQTATTEGQAWLSAVTQFLAQRYSGTVAPHGRIWNWVVGNEVNSHWWWFHMGRATMEEVVAAYEQAVRIVHTAVRRHSRFGRVFVSLEHHWHQRYAAGDAQQAIPGRDLLLAFAKLVRQNGDFDWHVAFHPYPENLFECRFWLDRTAPNRDDAHRVTFRNLPVLMRFLAQPELRHEGEVRRVILSEQGFHCADGEHGERDQAAALALAWSIVNRLPGIDALILHRHVDHAHEGGLRLGLWSRKPDSVCSPERRRRIGDVFLACDGPEWPACAEFALPVIGLASFADWPLGETDR